MIVRTALVLGLLIGGAGFAFADSSPDKVASAGTMSLAQVTSHLQSQGFTVSKIKWDDGHYKVKAIDSAGHKQKLEVSGATGAVISKSDDD